MAYSYYRSITIDHTKCGVADSSNFVLLFTGTYSWLATVANGGRATSSSGYDIVFAADSAGSTLLSFQRISYNATTGAVQFWVKVPSLSHSSDTVIYVLYADSGVTTDQANPTGTWPTQFKAVYHLGESGSPYLDSTSNANNSNAGTYPTQTTGLWGKAQSFTAASSQYIQLPNAVATGNVLTISAWVKTTGTAAQIFYDSRGNASLLGGVLYGNTSGANLFATFYYNNISGAVAGPNLSDGNWHYVVGSSTVDETSSFGPLWVDGVLVAHSAGGSASTSTTGHARIGAAEGTTPTAFMDGLIQEVRASITGTTTSMVLSEYNNQSSPSTFYAVGSETAFSGGTGRLEVRKASAYAVLATPPGLAATKANMYAVIRTPTGLAVVKVSGYAVLSTASLQQPIVFIST